MRRLALALSVVTIVLALGVGAWVVRAVTLDPETLFHEADMAQGIATSSPTRLRDIEARGARLEAFHHGNPPCLFYGSPEVDPAEGRRTAALLVAAGADPDMTDLYDAADGLIADYEDREHGPPSNEEVVAALQRGVPTLLRIELALNASDLGEWGRARYAAKLSSITAAAAGASARIPPERFDALRQAFGHHPAVFAWRNHDALYDYLSAAHAQAEPNP